MARETARIGQIELYRHKFGVANHPPLSGYYAAWVMSLSPRIGIPFPVLMKIPMLLADAMIAVLIWKIWAMRSPRELPGAWPKERSRYLGAVAVAAYAWNVVAILVGSFHCNTDIIYGAFCLLAVYLIDRFGWNFLGGLALAAAMNAKVIPLILIAPLLLQYRSWRPALAFLAGIAVGLIPFYPFFLIIPQSFWRNVFSYKPLPVLWGLNFPLLEMIFHGVAEPYARTVIDRFSHEGRWMVMGVILLLGLIARRRRWTRYELAASVQAAFLVLAPGFGVQYTILVAPMLCALSPPLGLAFGTAAGVFIGAVYWIYRLPGFPLASRFTGGIPEPAAILGLLAWLLLIVYLLRQLRTKPRTRAATLFPPFPTHLPTA